jgi:hypothetical protein
LPSKNKAVGLFHSSAKQKTKQNKTNKQKNGAKNPTEKKSIKDNTSSIVKFWEVYFCLNVITLFVSKLFFLNGLKY